MDFINSLFQVVVVFITVITAPVKEAVLPTPLVNPTATPSVVLISAAPSPYASPVEQFKPREDNTSKAEPRAENILRIKETFNYMNQETTVFMDIPKDGGKISGKISGLCNGTIKGEFNGRTVDNPVTSERKDINGEVTGTCRLGFIPVPASAKFFGEVSLSTKRAVLTVDVEKPLQGRWYPILYIQ